MFLHKQKPHKMNNFQISHIDWIVYKSHPDCIDISTGAKYIGKKNDDIYWDLHEKYKCTIVQDNVRCDVHYISLINERLDCFKNPHCKINNVDIIIEVLFLICFWIEDIINFKYNQLSFEFLEAIKTKCHELTVERHKDLDFYCSDTILNVITRTQLMLAKHTMYSLGLI